MNFTRKKKSFTTERLLIQKLRLADTEALFEAARESIDEIFPFMSWCHPDYKIGETIDWLTHAADQWQSGNAFAFSIRHKVTNRFLGGCGINKIDEHPTSNLGYWIRTSETGKGYATEATLGLIDYGFRQAGQLRIEIIMSIANIASKAVAEKSGAILEGTLKNRLFLHGKPHDAFLYALTPKPIPGLQDP